MNRKQKMKKLNNAKICSETRRKNRLFKKYKNELFQRIDLYDNTELYKWKDISELKTKIYYYFNTCVTNSNGIYYNYKNSFNYVIKDCRLLQLMNIKNNNKIIIFKSYDKYIYLKIDKNNNMCEYIIGEKRYNRTLIIKIDKFKIKDNKLHSLDTYAHIRNEYRYTNNHMEKSIYGFSNYYICGKRYFDSNFKDEVKKYIISRNLNLLNKK